MACPRLGNLGAAVTDVDQVETRQAVQECPAVDIGQGAAIPFHHDLEPVVLCAIALESPPVTLDLEQLQRADARAITGAALVLAGEHFAWGWQPDIQHLEQPLWPVAHSAIELLTTGDLRRIKVCENPYGCGWLFYDGSKNGSRRWCSMEGCGSQVKMRRLYAKRRATALP